MVIEAVCFDTWHTWNCSCTGFAGPRSQGRIRWATSRDLALGAGPGQTRAAAISSVTYQNILRKFWDPVACITLRIDCKMGWNSIGVRTIMTLTRTGSALVHLRMKCFIFLTLIGRLIYLEMRWHSPRPPLIMPKIRFSVGIQKMSADAKYEKLNLMWPWELWGRKGVGRVLRGLRAGCGQPERVIVTCPWELGVWEGGGWVGKGVRGCLGVLRAETKDLAPSKELESKRNNAHVSGTATEPLLRELRSFLQKCDVMTELTEIGASQRTKADFLLLLIFAANKPANKGRGFFFAANKPANKGRGSFFCSK